MYFIMNINDITIKYFSNKHIRDTNKIIAEDDNYEEDKKFYEKRIIDLTRKMLKNDPDEIPTQELKRIFNKYIEECIEHFKFKDYNDLHQEDLSSNLMNSKNIAKSNLDISNLNRLDISNLVNNLPKKINLDNFVLKKQNKKRIVFMPKETNYNLKDPKLKDKDIVYDISTG